MDRLRNEQIRSDLSVKPLLREIEESRLRWYGHIKRMDDGRMAKIYLEWKPHGRIDLWEGLGRDGLMELERRLRGEKSYLRTWRRRECMKTEMLGETLLSVCLLTDENLPGGW